MLRSFSSTAAEGAVAAMLARVPKGRGRESGPKENPLGRPRLRRLGCAGGSGSALAGRPWARLRASQASSEVSPRTLLTACCQARSAKASGTPASSTKAWATLMKNSKLRAKRSRGDEDAALAAAELDVAMADGGVGELVGVGAGDHGVFGRGLGGFRGVGGLEGIGVFAQRERNEVVSVGLEGGDDGDGDSLEHAVEIGGVDAGFAVGSEADAVGRLADLGFARDLSRPD